MQAEEHLIHAKHIEIHFELKIFFAHKCFLQMKI